MEKKVTVTEEQFMDYVSQAIDNLNKIEKLSTALTIFATIISVEIAKVLFDETSDTDLKSSL